MKLLNQLCINPLITFYLIMEDQQNQYNTHSNEEHLLIKYANLYFFHLDTLQPRVSVVFSVLLTPFNRPRRHLRGGFWREATYSPTTSGWSPSRPSATSWSTCNRGRHESRLRQFQRDQDQFRRTEGKSDGIRVCFQHSDKSWRRNHQFI